MELEGGVATAPVAPTQVQRAWRVLHVAAVGGQAAARAHVDDAQLAATLQATHRCVCCVLQARSGGRAIRIAAHAPQVITADLERRSAACVQRVPTLW